MTLLFTAAALVALTQSPPEPVAARQAPAPARSSDVSVVGTIVIGTVGGEQLTKPARAIYVDAVEQALAGRGFTLLPDAGHGRYVADVTIDRAARGVVSGGRAGGGAPQMSLNGGVSVGLGAGGERLDDLVVTRLTIEIRPRGEARVIWSGSAVTARVSNTPSGNVPLVARTLATAVMTQFPARTTGPVSIP